MSERQTTGNISERMEQFVRTIATLRSPEGCPWDREQTHLSIARNMIEEAHEAAWAIEQGDVANLREELGDVLLQVVLQAQMAAEAGEFTINDVITDINDKILRRHPHVFGDEAAFAAAHFSAEQVAQIQAARTAGEVIDLWDQIKLHEKAQKAARRPVSAAPEGLLDGVPQSLPALMQAQDISRKAVAAGFEWPTVNEIWQQVFSEIDEFNAAERGSDHAEEEFGDILFSLVNVARKEGVDAESALRASCRKFRRRWAIMEQLADERGYRLTESGTERLETLWQEAKGKQPSGLLSGEAANAAGEPLNA